MCATYKEKQKRSHFESFANKIYTGIREINPDYAEKRAIWELFQNALDTVSEKGKIEIVKTEGGFLFKHNGRPFKDDEFGGLIKQFSVGKSYGDNKEKLGQYGTGFISTHVYGKKIRINGSIQIDDGTYRTLKDFNLDRDAVSVEALTDKLVIQDEYIEQLCDDSDAIEHVPLPYTSFEYIIGEGNLERIDSMLLYVKSILPYIFCFNDKLIGVNISYDTTELEYVKTSSDDKQVSISINGVTTSIPVLTNPLYNVRVVLGTKDRVLANIPKKFLFYPLMDTNNAGHNFIVHANDFKPNRERDYLHRDNGNSELKLDVKTNELLLKTAFDLVQDKVKDDDSIPFMDIVKIEFTDADSNYEKELKINYITAIKDLARVSFDEGKSSLKQLQYFDDSILLLDEKIKKSIYEVVKQFLNIPSFEIYCVLSQYINNWNNALEVKFNTLTLTDIAEIVVNKSGGNYIFIDNKQSFRDFILLISPNVSLLNRLALIPNIHGDFKLFESLVKWENKEQSLIDIVDSVNSNISENYIHIDFEFLENINPYNREKFKDEFSKFCNDLVDDLAKDKDNISDLRFSRLVESLNNFVGLNKKTSLNIDVANFYNKTFQLIPNASVLSDPTVDINYQPAIKLLAYLYLRDLETTEISNNIFNLMEIVSIMFKSTNLKDELLHKLACIPNQNYILKSQAELKKDNVKDNDFKDVYDRIVGEKIRNELAFDGFEVFLQHSSSVNGGALGEAIETTLDSDKKFIPVSEEIIAEILPLIEKISERPNTWGEWLRNINEVKEEILMHKFKDANTRQSLFSILSVKPDKINLLGELAKIEDLDALIKAGKEKQKEEGRKNNHLQYINKIGLQIQSIIEKEIHSSLVDTIKIVESASDEKLKTVEEQNGQDFIIYKSGNPIYYIEVKSRWDVEGIVALSKRQVEKCAQNQGRYAVITVNVADYKARNKIVTDDISFEDLSEDIYTNLDLSENFEELIKQNRAFETISENTKLIEYRGHIPQDRIKKKGITFKKFIDELKIIVLN